MTIETLGAFRYIGLDADIGSLGGFTSIKAGAIFDAFDTQRKFVFDGSAWVEFTGSVAGDTLIFTGQSTDTKPTVDIPLGSRFVENDTGRTYVFDGIVWTYESIDDESANFNALESRSSFIQLFGDTFAIKPANTVFLLETLSDTSPTAGTSLTNNGAIDLTRLEDNIPLRGFLVPSLNGTNQFFSLPTENKVEVGVGGFVSSIQFRATKQDATQYIYSYGDINVSEQHWSLRVDAGNTIAMVIDDGSTTATATTSEPLRYHDGELHTATTIWQPTVGVFLFIDGELVASDTTALPTLTLNNVGTFLNIGTRRNAGATSQFFEGQVSNFQLYQADPADATIPPDFNLPAILHAGIRESANVGGITIDIQTGSRINNWWFNANNTNLDFMTSVINVSEGFYDLTQLYTKSTNSGIVEVSIDGQVLSTIDRDDALSTFNHQDTVSGIFLSGGTHILKIQVNGTTGGQFSAITNMIELIKRDGKDEGDDEATSGVLFGDELIQRSVPSGAGLILAVTTTAVYNSRIAQNGLANANDGDFFEGDIFLKKGLYKITITHANNTNQGIIDVFFGGVKVFDQLDTNGGSANNVQDTRQAFLEGGKTTVKVLVNGTTGTDFIFSINSIRFELVTGKSNGDVVNIFAADEDIQVISGDAFPVLVTDISRFNNTRFTNSAGTNIGDKYSWNRYFSGGTYKVEFIANANLDRAEIDIGFGGIADNIFDNLNYTTGGDNTKRTTTVTIPRGNQLITYEVVLATAGDAKALTRLQFTKIGTVISAENDDSSDPVHGALVPLAKFVNPNLASPFSHTFDLGGVGIDTDGKYSKVIVIAKGETGAGSTASLQAEINGENTTGEIFQQGTDANAGTLTGINESTLTFIQLIDIITANDSFNAELEIFSKLNGNLPINGTFHGFLENNIDYSGGWLIDLFDHTNIFQIIIRQTNGAWKVGSSIEVYGVKR